MYHYRVLSAYGDTLYYGEDREEAIQAFILARLREVPEYGSAAIETLLVGDSAPPPPAWFRLLLVARAQRRTIQFRGPRMFGFNSDAEILHLGNEISDAEAAYRDALRETDRFRDELLLIRIEVNDSPQGETTAYQVRSSERQVS
ncbi:Hypothetical protein PBC10988_23020 [Planctomycetales bacterium 10988]|nr:Hypothetical protein PBC10988_23020 [Planctomycetales bacterium 10988]